MKKNNNFNFYKLIKMIKETKSELSKLLKDSNEAWLCYPDNEKIISVGIKIKEDKDERKNNFRKSNKISK